MQTWILREALKALQGFTLLDMRITSSSPAIQWEKEVLDNKPIVTGNYFYPSRALSGENP